MQEALNGASDADRPDWARRIRAGLAAEDATRPLELRLLCGADLLESFAVPGLWKDEDVSPFLPPFLFARKRKHSRVSHGTLVNGDFRI